MKSSELGLSAMYRILKKAGAERVSDESANELRRIIEEVADSIAKSAVDMASHAGRKTVKAEDVKLASKPLNKFWSEEFNYSFCVFQNGTLAERLCVGLQSLYKGVRLPRVPYSTTTCPCIQGCKVQK